MIEDKPGLFPIIVLAVVGCAVAVASRTKAAYDQTQEQR